MAVVGDNIRVLHSRLIERGADCTLEWNSGGHFKDADLRTAKSLSVDDGGTHMTILIDADGCPVVDLTLQIAKAVCRSGHHPVRHRSPNRAGRCADAGVR